MTDNKLPGVCPQHPAAPIRHEWVTTRTIVGPRQERWEDDGNHRYYCSKCGLELAPPPEED